MSLLRLIPPFSVVQASLLARTFAIAVTASGFPLSSICVWAFEGLVIDGFTAIDQSGTSSTKVCYWGLWVVWTAMHAVQNYRDDGYECRRLDDILTRRGFHCLVKVIRKIDYARTPSAEKNAMLGFIGLWEGVNQAIQEVNALDGHHLPDVGENTPSDLSTDYLLNRCGKTLDCYQKSIVCYKGILDSYRKAAFSYRKTLDLYRHVLACYSKMPDCDGTILGYYDNILDSYDKILECYRTLNCCDETQECYKKISDYHNSLKGRGKTPERHGEQLDCYDQMLDCYKSIYNRCRGDVHVLLKDLVQSTEKTRDELSKLSVWKRAWVRPYMKDIDRGLKHLLVNTEKELRNTSEGTGESKMTLELDLPYGTKLDLPRGMVLPTASPASSRYARSDC